MMIRTQFEFDDRLDRDDVTEAVQHAGEQAIKVLTREYWEDNEHYYESNSTSDMRRDQAPCRLCDRMIDKPPHLKGLEAYVSLAMGTEAIGQHR